MWHLGSRGVDESQTFLPKDRFHQLGRLMNVGRKEKVGVMASLTLETIVGKEIVQAKVTSVVLSWQL